MSLESGGAVVPADEEYLRKTVLKRGRYVMVEAHKMETHISTEDQILASISEYPGSRTEIVLNLKTR